MKLLDPITKVQFDIWNNFINLGDKLFKDKDYEFNYQIQTDGISCCLLFIKKGLRENKKWGSKVPELKEQEFHNIEDLTLEQLEDLKLRNIVGCDPGKRNLVYMVDKNGEKLKYTCFQKKIESKAKRNMRVLLSEKNKTKIGDTNVISLETKLSTENSKSMDYKKFKSYLIGKDKLNRELKEFYQRDTWRKMKFREYSYSNKSIDNFLNKIQETFGSNVLIGYGNWSRDTQMKFFMPTMNKGLRKLIHKKYDTITINEHGTSKKCCGCHNNLSHYRDSNNKEVFRLLVCSGCVSSDNKKIVFRTRDVNSGVNIMDIASSWINTQTRPKSFCRTEQTPSSTDLNTQKELEKVGQSLLILPGSDPSLENLERD